VISSTGRQLLRLVEHAVAVEAEERVDVLGQHARAHIGASLFGGLRLEPQVAPQHPNLIGGEQRFGAGEAVRLAVMPVRGERDRGDSAMS
jgi:hypothetical protein